MNVEILREQEKIKYEWLNKNTDYGQSFHAKGRVDEIQNLIEEYEITSVIDVGTGRGLMCEWFEQNTDIQKIYGLDIAMDPVIPQTDRVKFIKSGAHDIQIDDTVDMVTSFDFFEHVVEQDVDIILTEMKRVCNTIMAHKVHYVTEKHHGHSTSHKETVGELHQTRREVDWWLEKFEQYGKARFQADKRLFIIEV
jgi:ubiquinone/menaquinone biosynthesis C-methylase UbiE